MSRERFFTLAFAGSALWYFFPGYIFVRHIAHFVSRSNYLRTDRLEQLYLGLLDCTR